MTSATTVTPLRADARRNRDAILSAARRVFADRGLDAPLDAIAREAGVGRATMQRRFPTRDSIVRAIFDDNLAELERLAQSTPDSADSYVEILRATVEMLVRDLGFVDLFNSRAVPEGARESVATRFLAIVAEPLRRAQDAGRIRADLRVEDTELLIDMMGAAAHTYGKARPSDRVDRALGLLLDAISVPR